MNWEVWGPPLIVVGTGLVAGLFVAFRSAGGGVAAPAAGSQRVEDLLARKQALLEQLRGLDAERTKVPPEEFRERWQATLDRAARTLRDLDRAQVVATQAAAAAPTPAAATPVLDAPAAAAPAAAPAPAAMSPGTRRLLWGLGTVGFFVLLGVTLAKTSTTRGEGGSMTGTTVNARDARMEQAKAALASNPQDLDAAAYLAHAAIRSGDLQGGMQYVDAGRRIDPEDGRIQASLAALMIAIGYLDRAEQTLDVVNTRSPELGTAWLWRGVLMMSKGDRAGAEAALEKAIQLCKDSEDRALAISLLSEVQSGAPLGGGAAGGDGNMGAAAPGTPNPHQAGGGMATAAASGTPRIQGRVELAGSASLPAGALVFIYARPSEIGRGPPLAALKIPASQLPLDFSITDGDVIMGGPWPDQVWVSAKIDLDGNAATKEEGVPASDTVGPLASGTAGVTLVLK